MVPSLVIIPPVIYPFLFWVLDPDLRDLRSECDLSRDLEALFDLCFLLDLFIDFDFERDLLDFFRAAEVLLLFLFFLPSLKVSFFNIFFEDLGEIIEIFVLFCFFFSELCLWYSSFIML